MEKISTKFWIIDFIEKFLISQGIGAPIAELVAFIAAILMLLLIMAALDFLGTKVLIRIMHASVKKSKTKWDDFLADRHFFGRLIRFLFTVVLIFLINTIFTGFNPSLVQGALLVSKCTAIFFILTVITAFIDAASDIYMTLPQSQSKSIKGYVQIGKMTIYIIGSLFIISVLFKVDMSKILVAMATSAAVITLVFKDTILGFVASIQLSAQDMVRLGDWIEMKSKGADGVVVDINVNTVKVQNWDNTFTMIPIYTMVSDSFINWRGMEESQGRRFKRPFLVDLTTIHVISAEQFQALSKNDVIGEYFEEVRVSKCMYSVDSTTNLSVFRAWIEAYLRNNEVVNEDLTLMVHYLPMSDYGMPIEIYGYTKDKTFLGHEKIMCHITDHIIGAAYTLGLRLFQRSTNIIDGPSFEVSDSSRG